MNSDRRCHDLPLSTDVPIEPTPTATLIQLQATTSPIDSTYNPEVAMSNDAVSALSSLLYLMLILQPMQVHDKGEMKATEDPKDWTVEDVTSWLKKKRIDQKLCDQFAGASSSYSRIPR